MKKNQIILIILVVVLIGGLIFFLTRSKNNSPIQEQEVTPTETVIPTVDSSVKVSLNPRNSNKEVTLELEGITQNTTTVEYALSYMTQSQGLQGLIGTINLDDGESTYEKELTLGTCSSGTCVYHQVVGSIKVELKFTGSYGDKVLSKEFSLN